MDKALKMGRASASGSYMLFLGTVSSTVIMAVGTIIFVRLMSPSEYGLYSIALVPSFTLNLFCDWGISSALTKYIAQSRALEGKEDVHTIVLAGLIFEAITGLILTFISLFTAGFVASVIFHRPELYSLISIVAITVVSNALLTAARSSFVGFERMELSSITSICQAVVKSIATPLLVFLGLGALGATVGYTLSLVVPSFLSLALIYYLVFARKLRKNNTTRSEIVKTLKMMLHYGVPLSISSNLVGFMGQFFSFMMASYCSDLLVGNYQSAIQFATIITFVTTPISTVLFPAFAKLDTHDKELLQTVYLSSIKYTTLLLTPITMAMMILANPMISTLFGDKWIYAPFYLTVYVTGNLLVGLGSLSMVTLLVGLGETKMLLKQAVLTTAFGISLAPLLVPSYGILGVILGNLLAGVPSMCWGLYWIWHRYKLRADFRSSALILLSAIIAAASAYLVVNVLKTADWIELIAGMSVFLATYVVVVPLVRAVNSTDVKNLKDVFSGMRGISKIMGAVLSIVEKLAVQ